MPPYLSVIIPTYNRSDKLEKCLRALQGQTLSQDSFEVIVVNDGSSDDTEKLLTRWKEAWPLLKILHQKNSGQGIARNHALSKAEGQIILFIGDDIYCAPDFLKKHTDFHQENPGTNFACLGLTVWDPAQPISPFMDWLTSGGPQFAYHHLSPQEEASFWYFYTSNLSLKKEFLAEERFDSDFKAYGFEDIELGYRLFKKGLKLVYCPEALALHDHPMEEGSLKKRMQNIGASALIFQSKAPEISVVPRGFKKLLLKLASSFPVLGFFWIAKSLFPALAQRKYWVLLSKKYFLKGLSRRKGEYLL
ncbi:hypothetical protein A3J23_00440 [Candidatus Peregrinibacteria bacterium RIFCSPLOWO2_02_FULL_48_14]|nr:MAG: hypothetical protein A3J23_00440 [Candidatus Peregrinibacteria bacterium RIFCSPLOWO2_02_FULL_48_14]